MEKAQAQARLPSQSNANQPCQSPALFLSAAILLFNQVETAKRRKAASKAHLSGLAESAHCIVQAVKGEALRGGFSLTVIQALSGPDAYSSPAVLDASCMSTSSSPKYSFLRMAM